MKKRLIGIIMLLNVLLILCIGVGVVFKQKRQYNWVVPEQTEYETTLRVAADVDYKPFSFVDENGNPAGYDVELIYTIGEYLQTNIDLELKEWSEAVSGLNNGDYDLLLGVTYSPERLGMMKYSLPLLEEHYTMFGQNMEQMTLADLSGTKIALVENDSVEEVVIKPYGLEDSVIHFSTYTDCFQALAKGECNFVIAPSVTGKIIMKEQGIQGIDTYHTFIYNSIYCIGALKENFAEIDRVNEAITALRSDGILDRIYDNWLVEYMKDYSLLTILTEYKETVIIGALILLFLFSMLLFLHENTKSRHLRLEEESRLQLKETAAMLRQERQQYREALLCECLYSFSFDITSGFLTEEYTNGSESVLKQLGLTLPVKYDEVMEKWRELVHPQSLYKTCPVQEAACFAKAFEQGRRSLEFEYYLPDTDTYERQTLFLFKNEENQHIVACAIAKDITEIRKKEEQTKRALAQLTKVAEKIAQGDLEVEIECCGEGEVKILADSLSKTTAELKKRIAYINELAYLDLLTGLANKTAYAKRIEALEVELSVNPQMQFGMAMLDINNLKMVNDSMGHEMGDLFIQEATGLMKDIFKECIIYRVGGDEFVILFFPPLLEQMEHLVTEFEEHMAEYNRTHQEFPCGVWVAVGYSVYDFQKDTKYIDVFKRADELMYWDKSQKKAFANRTMRVKTDAPV